MSSHWSRVGLKSNMTDGLRREESDRDSQEEGIVLMEATVGVMLPQAKGLLKTPEARNSHRKILP